MSSYIRRTSIPPFPPQDTNAFAHCSRDRAGVLTQTLFIIAGRVAPMGDTRRAQRTDMLHFWIQLIALHTVLSLTPSLLAIAEWLIPSSLRCFAFRPIRW